MLRAVFQRNGWRISPTDVFDICVLGHVTRDVVVREGRILHSGLGGAAFYTGAALGRLGARVAVVTRTAAADREEVTAALAAAGVHTVCLPSVATTHFENRYTAGSDRRQQVVSRIADPFSPADLGTVRAHACHLGPLTRFDMPATVIEAAAQRGFVSIDVQGIVRDIVEGKVVAHPARKGALPLSLVDVVKADLGEARLVTGETDPKRAAKRLVAMGAREALVTLGSAGAVVIAGQDMRSIPAFPVAAPVDPTGCGDSFCAGYLFRRLAGADAETAGRFAAAVAALKLQGRGPFAGSRDAVDALIGQRDLT